MATKKFLIIGLDGATFDVINPLIKEGRMPNIENLIKEGASGVLQSTIPPVTSSAWLSMATSLTPGKTGIYDFIKRTQENGYRFTMVNSSDYRGRAVWDYLSNSGKRVGIVNYPNLYPPYKINGFFVSGGIGSPKESAFTYPLELENEVKQFIGYDRQLNLKDPKYKNLDLFINDVNDMFKKRLDCTKYLLAEKEWDLFWAVFPETDWIQHMMWKYIDPHHSDYRELEAKRYRDKFKRFWNLVDKGIGELKEITGGKVNIVIASDHGFGPCYNQSFRLNTWLKYEGYFKPKKRASTIFWLGKKLRRGLKKIVELFRIDRRMPLLVHWGKRATTSLAILVNVINYKNSIAFDPGHIGTFGGIYINDYVVKDPALKEKIKREISDKLYKYGKENDLNIEIYRPEKLYGNKFENSMDLIIRVNKGGCTVEKWGFDKQILDKLPPRISFLSGTHRINGVFIASGPDFAQAKVKQARLWDIPPTILYCFSEPIPDSMEGRVLMEAVKGKEQPRYEKGRFKDTWESKKKVLTNNEEKEIKKQLSDLGYF